MTQSKAMKSFRRHWKGVIASVMVLSLLTACGQGLADDVASRYPLVDVLQGEGGSESRVYRAEGTSVAGVERVMRSIREPKQSGGDAERLFMVYDRSLVQIMPDPKTAGASLIEVSNREFVERHYDVSFLQAYIALEILDEVFDMVKYSKYKRDYGGYAGSGGGYVKSVGGAGSVRFGSAGAANPRGGGPGTGK